MGIAHRVAARFVTVSRLVKRAEARRTAERHLEAFGVKDLAHLNAMGRRFAVISGYRAELHKHENQQRHGDMMGDLQRMGYRNLVPMKSAWEDMATGVVHREKSVLVAGMSFSDATHLMKEYKQDAVLYKDPSGTIGIYFNDGTALMAFEPTKQDLAVLMSESKGEYSKGRSFSFGLQLVDDRKFHWSGGPVTHDEVVGQLATAA